MNRNLYRIPDVKSGFELTDEDGWFSVILPQESTNLVTNPKFALGTTGYTASSAAIARTTDYQRRGIYGLKVTPNLGAEGGVYYGTISTTADTVYAFSCDIKGKAGVRYAIYFATNAGAQIGEKVLFYATGDWQRVAVIYPETTTTTRRLYVTRVSPAADVTPFYVDGFQCEASEHPTTYLDGDMTGFVVGQTAYLWNGVANASTSTRIAATRHGGREVNLDDYGVVITGVVGLRMPTFTMVSTKMAKGGITYQTSIPQSRDFSLVCTMFGEIYDDLDYNFKQLEDALNPKKTGIDQEMYLVFHRIDCKGHETKRVLIPCVYKSGLEGAITNPNQEPFSLLFTQPQPYIYEDGNYATQLLPGTVIEGACGIAMRDNVTGNWFTPGTGASTVSNINVFFEASDGLVYIGGSFSQIDGVAANNLIIYNPVTGAFSDPFGGGAGFNGEVRDIVEDTAAGVLYIVGAFTTVNGGAVNYICTYTIATTTFAAMAGGGANGSLYGCDISDSRILYVAGGFTSICGTASWSGAFYDIATATWTTMGSGGGASGLNAGAYDVLIGADGETAYYCGVFTTADGTATIGAAYWDGSGWVANSSGLDTSGGGFSNKKLALGIDGKIYMVRESLGVPVLSVIIAYYNGSYWIDISGGITYGNTVFDDPSNNKILVGIFNATVAPYIDNGYVYYFNGNYNRLDVTLFNDYGYGALGTKKYLYLSTEANQSIFVQNTQTITQEDFIIGIPTFIIKGPGTIQRMQNFSVDKNVFMEYPVLVNNQSSITLGNKITTVPAAGKGTVLPGSQPWFLNPGDNIINVFVSTPYYETGDGNDQLDRWELITGLTLDNTDNMTVYVNVVDDGGGFYHTDIYQDSAKAAGDLIGHTASYNASGEEAIVADNASGLGGVIYVSNLTGFAADTDIVVTFGQIFMTWVNVYDSISKVLL